MLFRTNIIWEKRGHNGHDALRGFCFAEVNTLKPLKDSGENNAHNPIIQLMLLLIYLFSISKIPDDLQNRTVPLTHSYITFILSLLILSLQKSMVNLPGDLQKHWMHFSSVSIQIRWITARGSECSLCLVNQTNFLQLTFVPLAGIPSV